MGGTLALWKSFAKASATMRLCGIHLGSMPAQVRRLVKCKQLRPGEIYVGNDPFDGGTHLPDLTLLEPVYLATNPEECLGIVAVRAHHADIGGTTPGSMSSQADIFGEGLRIPLIRLVADGQWDPDILALLLANMRSPSEREGDLLAQRAACLSGSLGIQRVVRQWAQGDLKRWNEGQQSILKACENLTRSGLTRLLDKGRIAQFEDHL